MSPCRKPPKNRQKATKTAEELERLITERFGVRPVQVSVRALQGKSAWDATLIANRTGNAARHAEFWTLIRELRDEFGLKG